MGFVQVCRAALVQEQMTTLIAEEGLRMCNFCKSEVPMCYIQLRIGDMAWGTLYPLIAHIYVPDFHTYEHHRRTFNHVQLTTIYLLAQLANC